MSPPARPRGGLFRRIFATFVITVVVSTVVSAVGAYILATGTNREWVENTLDVLDAREDELHAAADDPAALGELVDALERELGTQTGVYVRGRAGAGRKIAGTGPEDPPPQMLASRRELRRFRPVTFHVGMLKGQGVALALRSNEGPRGEDDPRRRLGPILVVYPNASKPLLVPAVMLTILVGILGIGAGVLSRSITRRLERLGDSAHRIAAGDLKHRAEAREGARADEIDQLGSDFNDMAGKVDALLLGQRTLLANVSHELRTPIARMKVLLEILSERVDNLHAREIDAPSRDVVRLRKGLTEMSDDVVEIEALISDLLTSGRLQLREGAGVPLERALVDVAPMLEKLAGKVGARVSLSDPNLSADLDEVLVERLLSNLLANGRRACPDGEIVVAARDLGGGVEITVTDEGPGVPPKHREEIFEPFRRLDAARDRDRGGVGLGLYLSRQICQAHGGSIRVEDRPDGASGAHFVVTLPASRPAA